MTLYSTEPRIRKYVKIYWLLSLARKYRKKLLDTGLDAVKTASKKVFHKTAETTGELRGNKITNKIVKQKSVIHENSWDIEKIITPSGKREDIINKL